MSYASSSSSSDSLSDHSIFDPFGTLTGTTFDPFTSSFSSSHCNSPPTSFTSPIADYDDQYSAFKRNTDSFIQTLLKGKREQEVALRAWRVRCDALESEVLRLSGLVLQLETEKKALEVQKKEVKPVVVEQVQTRQPHHSHTSPPPSVASARCDCSPDCVAPTPCRWTGATWEPLPAPTRPTIDPTKPMSRQNPPPCNAFYLIGHCDVPRCRFEHQYELTVDQVAEMRRGALHHVCNAVRNGVECPDGEDCIYGHFCPRGPACGRERCGFNDEQHRIIPAPRPVVRRR